MSGPKPPDKPAPSPDQILDHELVSMLDEMLTAPERERILSRAQAQLKGLLDALRDDWSRADLRSVERGAHQLAGLAGSVGCVRLTDLAREIEIACRQSRRSEIEGQLDALAE